MARARTGAAAAYLETRGDNIVEAPTVTGTTSAVATRSGTHLGTSVYRPPPLHLVAASHTALTDNNRDVDGALPPPPLPAPVVSEATSDRDVDGAPPPPLSLAPVIFEAMLNNSSCNTRHQPPLPMPQSPVGHLTQRLRDLRCCWQNR